MAFRLVKIFATTKYVIKTLKNRMRKTVRCSHQKGVSL